MSDRIIITGLQVFARHGVLPAEAELGQRFVLDIAAHLDLCPAGRSDDVVDTVSYADMAAVAERVLTTERYRLIEAAAQAVADALFALDGRIERLAVTLHKPGAPVAAVFGDIAVAIERTRAPS